MEKREFITKLKSKKSRGFEIFKTEKQKEILAIINELAYSENDAEKIKPADFAILVEILKKVEEAEEKRFEFDCLDDLNENNRDNFEKKEYEYFIEKVKKATKGFNVYLWGDKGNGKSHLAKELAQNLGLELIVQNSAMSSLDFQGMKDIQGRYTYSLLELAFKGGKSKTGALLVLEEMDSYNPNALIFLNSVLEQGYITTLDGEIIEKHPKTVIVACGNTDLLTPSMQYSERNTIDIATADRFLRFKMPNYEYLNKLVAGNYYEKITAKIEELHGIKSVRNYARLKKILDLDLDFNESAESILSVA